MFRVTAKILLECYQIVYGGNIVKNKQDSCQYVYHIKSCCQGLEMFFPTKQPHFMQSHLPMLTGQMQRWSPKAVQSLGGARKLWYITQTSAGWHKKAITIALLHTVMTVQTIQTRLFWRHCAGSALKRQARSTLFAPRAPTRPQQRNPPWTARTICLTKILWHLTFLDTPSAFARQHACFRLQAQEHWSVDTFRSFCPFLACAMPPNS